MAAERSYSKDFSYSSRIVFNEAAIGLEDPIGKTVTVWGREMEIIGVAKDFHFQSLHETLKPLFLFLNPQRTNNVILKIDAGREQEVINSLQEFYQTYTPKNMIIERTEKEIIIRLPANVDVSELQQLIDYLTYKDATGKNDFSLLTQPFLRFFPRSCSTAIPRIWVHLVIPSTSPNRWPKNISGRKTRWQVPGTGVGRAENTFPEWLGDFAFRIKISWQIFLLAGLGAGMIAAVTVAGQAVTAALANPIKSIKNE